MKNWYLITVLFFLPIVLFSQQKDAFIEMKNKTHDFGRINESDGRVQHKFVFTNTGKTPVIITNVKSTCGCTTPSYSKAPVLPGESGFIEVTYNPKNRPGPFNKYITINSNALNNPLRINIKGFVIGSVQESIENPTTIREKYKFPMGALEATTNHLAFSKIDYKGTVTKSIGLFNSSENTVNVSFKNVPKHIKVSVIPANIEPGGEAEVAITYFAKEKNDWGFVFDRIQLYIDGEAVSSGLITVSANIIEKFEGLTDEELAMAATINFESTYYNFDTIPQDTIVIHRFMFRNTGKSDLKIRKVKASCGCTASYAGSNMLAPGEKSYIEAKFNSGKREGKQTKTITIVSNDPKNTITSLQFGAYVIPHGKE